MEKNLQNLFTIFSKFGNCFIKFIPQYCRKILIRVFRSCECKLCFGIRYILYKSLCNSFGEKVIIFPNVYIFALENFSVGNNVSIHEFSYIDATGGITIGSNVMIAHRCSIMSTSHKIDRTDIPFKHQGIVPMPVSIGDNCWIGTDVKIINGIKIGNNVVIGAGSVVNKNVQDNKVVAGVPVKEIRTLRYER